MIIYVIQEIWGNENSPNSLNAMINYYYSSENRVIPIYGTNITAKKVFQLLNYVSTHS